MEIEEESNQAIAKKFKKPYDTLMINEQTLNEYHEQLRLRKIASPVISRNGRVRVGMRTRDAMLKFSKLAKANKI